ncbi:MAG: glycerol kinase, partial [Chloroflexi bacterium]|nr:glycerol kinase [Chloroflexota bacterium]
MVDENHILAIDQGTTGSTAILFNKEGRVVSTAYQEIRQIYPQPGWVEHDPKEIYSKSLSVTKEAIQKARLDLTQIKGIGITNQRETTIVWERHTGEPVSNAIVWQCRRTAAMCEELKQKGYGPLVRDKTGLVIDAYFSATKLRWILDHIPNGQKRAESGELLFGTVDTWLAWNLTGGRAHVTDYSNASRTMLFNIHTLEWDRDLLAVFDIPQATLPRAI